MYTEYITIQGDRWDTIAYAAYGDATAFNAIQDANPNIPLSYSFDGGVKLLIPVITVQDAAITELLPPWKRVSTTSVQAADNVTAQQAAFNSGAAGSFDKSFD